VSRPHSPPKSLCFSLFLNHSFSSFLIFFFNIYSCSGLVLVSVSALFATSLLNGFLFGVCWFTFFLNDFFGEFCYLLSLSQEEGKKSCFIYGRSFSAATCLFFGRELFIYGPLVLGRKRKKHFFLHWCDWRGPSSALLLGLIWTFWLTMRKHKKWKVEVVFDQT
jgi:hypothetical protein